jgi:uncharacterized glyoxalase superfamily protein PhnB
MHPPRFLVDVLGFTEALVVPGPDGSITHAELRWPEGGAVMLGSTGHPTDGVHDAMKPGSSPADPNPAGGTPASGRRQNDRGIVVSATTARAPTHVRGP